VESAEILNELLGVKPEVEINDELRELFMSIFENIHRNLKKAHKDLELFRRRAAGIPAVAFLELLMLQKESSPGYADTLQKYRAAYPDYSMITLLWLIHIYSEEIVPEEVANRNFNVDTLFPGRDSLHYLEMFYFLMFILNVVSYEGNADRMEAFFQVLDEFDLPEQISKTIEDSFSLSRIEYIADYFDIEI
jgi:hypothetical protein